MKERPIIFSGESVRAILAGQKTQTRRVVKPQSLFEGKEGIIKRFPHQTGCPYGQIGDQLWAREAWYDDFICGFIYKASCSGSWHWRSPIFMPRWASRITLEITDIRVEHVRQITIKDCQAEGSPNDLYFREAWDRLNAKRGYSWSSNPWVWVIIFKLLEVK